jgi:hypothetical protein
MDDTSKKLLANSKKTIQNTTSLKTDVSTGIKQAENAETYARLRRKERINTEREKPTYYSNKYKGRQDRKYDRSIKRTQERSVESLNASRMGRLQQLQKYRRDRTQAMGEINSPNKPKSEQELKSKINKINKGVEDLIEGDNRKRLAKATDTRQAMAKLSINSQLTKPSEIKQFNPVIFKSKEQKALRVDFFKAKGWDAEKYKRYKALKDKQQLTEAEKIEFEAHKKAREELKTKFKTEFLNKIKTASNESSA